FTTPPIRWAQCSTRSWRPSPNSRSTCCGPERKKAWPSPAPRASYAAVRRSSRPSNSASSCACTAPASTPSPTSPRYSPSPAPRCTAPCTAATLHSSDLASPADLVTVPSLHQQPYLAAQDSFGSTGPSTANDWQTAAATPRDTAESCVSCRPNESTTATNPAGTGSPTP